MEEQGVPREDRECFGKPHLKTLVQKFESHRVHLWVGSAAPAAWVALCSPLCVASTWPHILTLLPQNVKPVSFLLVWLALVAHADDTDVADVLLRDFSGWMRKGKSIRAVLIPSVSLCLWVSLCLSASVTVTVSFSLCLCQHPHSGAGAATVERLHRDGDICSAAPSTPTPQPR